MWNRAADIAQLTLNRSGAARPVEAERILALTNQLGKDEYQAVFFRAGLLTIAAKDADPFTLQADRLKIQNTLNKILKKPLIKKLRIIAN